MSPSPRRAVRPLTSGRATGAALFFSYAGALVVPPALGVIVDGSDSWALAWLVAAAGALLGLVGGDARAPASGP